MTKTTPDKVTCPSCGKTVTNRGYQNHVNKCRNMSELEKKTVKRIRHMPR